MASCQMCDPKCPLRTGRSYCRAAQMELSGISVSHPCGSGGACFIPSVTVIMLASATRATPAETSRCLARAGLGSTIFGCFWDLPELQLLLCKDIPYFFQAWQVIICEELERAGSQSITANIGQGCRHCHQGNQAQGLLFLSVTLVAI